MNALQEKSRRSALACAFLGLTPSHNQNNPNNTMQSAAIHAVATTTFAGSAGGGAASSPAALPDIEAFHDQLTARGGVRALDEETCSADCQRMLEQLESVNFEQAPKCFLDNYVTTIQKMTYWREQRLIVGQTQRIFELFFKFCKSPQLYQTLSEDSLIKMVSILGAVAKEENCPQFLVDRILRDLNPELPRISRIKVRKNGWIPNAVISMTRLGCFTAERAQMFNILIPQLVRMKTLRGIRGFEAAKEAFHSFVQSSENLDTQERQNFVGVVYEILRNWSVDSMRARTKVSMLSPSSQLESAQ